MLCGSDINVMVAITLAARQVEIDCLDQNNALR